MGPPRMSDPAHEVDQIIRLRSIEVPFVESIATSTRARIVARARARQSRCGTRSIGPHAASGGARRRRGALRLRRRGVLRAGRRRDARRVGRPARPWSARAAQRSSCATRLELPDGWTVEMTLPCRQMVLPDTAGDRGDDASELLLVLGEDDVPEMLALVERTRPGPFARRTIELGSLPRRPGRRRRSSRWPVSGMHPSGYTEISAVCTDADQRGRGLASRLVRALVRGIRGTRRNAVPAPHDGERERAPLVRRVGIRDPGTPRRARRARALTEI